MTSDGSEPYQKEMRQFGSAGTILEAAFVDPAYQWPSPDGAGKNAIELQASVNIMLDDNESVKTTESQKERMTIPKNPRQATGKKTKMVELLQIRRRFCHYEPPGIRNCQKGRTQEPQETLRRQEATSQGAPHEAALQPRSGGHSHLPIGHVDADGLPHERDSLAYQHGNFVQGDCPLVGPSLCGQVPQRNDPQGNYER
mmetsp:Transcript_17398/g.43410  ORF Transcript_17398/g.43410 Transcript_17398/m.43410 type:complete len:199 (+) Transcript_17398:238-834(+)